MIRRRGRRQRGSVLLRHYAADSRIYPADNSLRNPCRPCKGDRSPRRPRRFFACVADPVRAESEVE